MYESAHLIKSSANESTGSIISIGGSCGLVKVRLIRGGHQTPRVGYIFWDAFGVLAAFFSDKQNFFDELDASACSSRISLSITGTVAYLNGNFSGADQRTEAWKMYHMGSCCNEYTNNSRGERCWLSNG